MEVFLKMNCWSWRTSLLIMKAVAEMFPISAISKSLLFTNRSLSFGLDDEETVLLILAPA